MKNKIMELMKMIHLMQPVRFDEEAPTPAQFIHFAKKKIKEKKRGQMSSGSLFKRA